MKKNQKTTQREETLFSTMNKDKIFEKSPLSFRMRPQTLDEYVGQEHILGEGKLLPRAIASDRLGSLIFYGPPGTGKTTLAYLISLKTQAYFEKINAVSANVDDLRKIIANSQHRMQTQQHKTIVFIDEIHRFNKAQQDVLMPDLEEGHLILIGATTQNPYFSLNSPLLSRSMIFELMALRPEDIVKILKRALRDKKRGLGDLNVNITEEALEFITHICDGDARKALNALEIGSITTPKDKDNSIPFTLEVAQESIQKKQVVYEKDGDNHYDTISAFIKSMRGSDPDATLYWLAKMLYAGEDVRFISRRICICAAEDVGNADPQALVVANSAVQMVEFIGLPEGRIPLAQAALYVACAPKSNAAYLGINKAMEDVKNKKTQSVPNHLRDTHYSGAKKLSRGEGYKYAHDYPQHYVKQKYMPSDVRYYHPTEMGFEKKIREWLSFLKNQTEK